MFAGCLFGFNTLYVVGSTSCFGLEEDSISIVSIHYMSLVQKCRDINVIGIKKVSIHYMSLVQSFLLF